MNLLDDVLRRIENGMATVDDAVAIRRYVEELEERRMSSLTPEGKVKRKLTEMLRRNGVWYFFPAANGFGKAGIPDVICIVDGLFVGIECKADKTKKPTVLQQECARKIQKAGGKWFLVYDEESISLVEEWISAYCRESQSDCIKVE